MSIENFVSQYRFNFSGILGAGRCYSKSVIGLTLFLFIVGNYSKLLEIFFLSF